MDGQSTDSATARSLAVRVALKAGQLVAIACLSAVDWYHAESLRVKAGEREVPATKRIRFPPEVRRRVSQRQSNLCMYCGIALLRLNTSQRHIDHKMPVERGGPNEEQNLQALCARCNSRKGVQSDEEFRERYGELLAHVQPGHPPAQRIEQKKFTDVSKRTRQLASTEAARKAVFKTPASKISSASVTAGIVLAVVWFIAVALTFTSTDWGGTAAFFGAPAVFAATWLGSMWRARFTGLLDSEYVDKASLGRNETQRR